MPLPDWIAPTVAQVQNEADVEARLLFSTVSETQTDDERIATLINGHIETQAAYVWGEARANTGKLSLPPSLAQIKTAFPFEAPDGSDEDETASLQEAWELDSQSRIDTLQEQLMLAVKDLVISKLLYSATNDEQMQGRARTHYINGMSSLRGIKKQIKAIRAAYLINTVDPIS